MNDSSLKFLLSQLAFQAPTLIVCLIGALLAIIFIQRHPRPSLLTLLGCGLLLIAAITSIGIQSYLLQQRTDGGLSAERHVQLSELIGICLSIARALGLALLVAAVFVGRARTSDVRA